MHDYGKRLVFAEDLSPVHQLHHVRVSGRASRHAHVAESQTGIRQDNVFGTTVHITYETSHRKEYRFLIVYSIFSQRAREHLQ